MSFIAYDLIFLAVFSLFVILFLYSRRKNLQRQGILYLYKTKIGIEFMDKFAKKFRKILVPGKYVVIASGYILMVSIIWLMVKTTYIYLTTSISQLIKAPPLAPLIPYFPKIFGLESFFPPLYFTYFIIALAIVAIVHEFSHGIFARLEGFKIHTTGFAFLGPILGAFVEPDEKEMAKAKKVPQLAVLAAGTFANILMVILFGVILMLFFSASFTPMGVKFNTYAASYVPIEGLQTLPSDIASTVKPMEGYTAIMYEQKVYYIETDIYDIAKESNAESVLVYENSPAFRAQLEGAITKFDGVDIRSGEDLTNALQSHKPGDTVEIDTRVLENDRDSEPSDAQYEVTLGESDEGKTYLGIGFIPLNDKGLIGKFQTQIFSKIKNPYIYYESKIGEMGWFIYYLLWWIVVINFFVALFNMLPLGILDGGRFFLLTIWGITGSEKIGKKAYSVVTWFLLFLFLVLMIKWAIAFF